MLLKREIDILRTVDHPTIIRLEDIYEDDDNLHLVTAVACDQAKFSFVVPLPFPLPVKLSYALESKTASVNAVPQTSGRCALVVGLCSVRSLGDVAHYFKETNVDVMAVKLLPCQMRNVDLIRQFPRRAKPAHASMRGVEGGDEFQHHF